MFLPPLNIEVYSTRKVFASGEQFPSKVDILGEKSFTECMHYVKGIEDTDSEALINLNVDRNKKWVVLTSLPCQRWRDSCLTDPHEKHHTCHPEAGNQGFRHNYILIEEPWGS